MSQQRHIDAINTMMRCILLHQQLTSEIKKLQELMLVSETLNPGSNQMMVLGRHI